MTPENVRSAADARKIVEERKLDHVKVGVFDNDGVMRGKYMGRDKFFSAPGHRARWREMLNLKLDQGLPRVGHFPQEEAPELVLPLIQEFLGA